jgi:RNA polymerase sigma factor (TIGR02999 family)
VDDPQIDVTRILERVSAGDAAAMEELMPAVYQELRNLAGSYVRRERVGHTLQPTALVNEAYLRLVKGEKPSWKDRAHFLATAARVMRNILVDYAVSRRRLKRGGKRDRVPLEGVVVAFEERALDLLALSQALDRLAEFDEQKSRIVELRFFGGLTIAEASEVLGVSHATVEREWKVARAWLHREITGQA